MPALLWELYTLAAVTDETLQMRLQRIVLAPLP